MQAISSPAKQTAMNKRYPLLAVSRLRMEIDGEGVTTLIAGAGCPLSCKYCINKAVLQTPPKSVAAEELYDKVKIDDLYFQATGGGVTFGGGESLLHAEFIRKFRTLCQDRWHIYAETSLNVPSELVRIAASCVDGFIVDVKDMNPEIYRAYTSRDNAQVIENLKLLLKLVGQERIFVRIPLIPNYNTADDQQNSIAALKSLGLTRFDVFTYRT